MYRYITFLILFLASFSYAQEMKFSGMVNDTVNDKPLEGAVVMAVRLSDGMLLGFTRSKVDGTFELNGVAIDTMELVISHYRFDEKRYYIIGSEENNEINIPNIILPKEAQLLDEVVVYANSKPIYFRGDTLVYTADSFAVKENAVVEDLLKKLPGLEVDDDGNVSSQGRKISKVLVDGDEFFGSDPTIATRNLRADGVDRVEVYETEDDNSGGNVEEKIQVLDVKLKDDAKRGYFGKVSGRGGFNVEYFKKLPSGSLFYEGDVLFNYFDHDLKISVFGLASNTPNTGFTYQDASRFGLTNEMQGGWRRFLPRSSLTGLPENYKAGFYFTDKFGKKKNVKLGVNYTFNDSKLDTDQERNGQYFFEDTLAYNKLDGIQRLQSEQSHVINAELEYKINDKTKLEFKSNLKIRNQNDEESSVSDYYLYDTIRFNSTSIYNKTDGDGLDANAELKFTKDFEKRFRQLKIDYQFGYTQSELTNMLQSSMYFGQFNTPDSTFDQKRIRNNHTLGHRALIDYTEPITRSLRLKFQYRLDYFDGIQKTSTYDRTPTGYDGFTSLYSNDFSNNRLENRAGIGLYYTDKNQTIEVGTRARNVMIENLNNVTNEAINQNINNLLPYAEYTYKFSNAERVQFSYSTSSSQPSLDQLQPVRDNTNPNNLVIGNPDLKPDYSHTLTLFYNKWNAISQSYVFVGGYFTYDKDAFSNSINYLPNGHTVSTAINVDNNMYGGFYAGGGIPLFKKILSLSPRLNGGYTSFNSEILNQMNRTQNFNVDGSLGLELRNDTMEVSISASYSYNYPMSTLSMGVNEPFSIQRYKATVFFELPWRFFIDSDVTWEINSRRAEGFNANPLIWNAKLSRKFLKTGNLIIDFGVYDIFNQNVGISRSVSTNVITDVRSRIIARYFMFGATWRFNNSKTKEDDGKNRWF